MSIKYDTLSVLAEKKKYSSFLKSRVISTATSGSLVKVHQPSGRNTKVVVLESEPPLVLEKKTLARIGKTRKILQRDEQIKQAADAVMKSRDPSYKARYAKQKHYQKQRNQTLPHIEVLEVEGNVLLGIPASSTAQQFATFAHDGHRKQIVIATHEPTHTPTRRVPGAMRQTETDAAVMKSGVVSRPPRPTTAPERQRRPVTLRRCRPASHPQTPRGTNRRACGTPPHWR